MSPETEHDPERGPACGPPPAGRAWASALGLAAIVFWGSTIAVSRDLTERLGTLTTPAVVYLIGGAAACGTLLSRSSRRRELRSLPGSYWVACGLCFVTYTVSLYLAIGLAGNRQQVLEVGLLNYLWPTFTLVFSVPVLGGRWRPALAAGVAIAFSGVLLAFLERGAVDPALLVRSVTSAPLPYALALVAAVTWGLYNNLARRLGGHVDASGVPVFLLASGLVLAALRLARPESGRFAPDQIGEILYLALLPTWLAYELWDGAMRRGNLVLLASASYATPLLSTALSCVILKVAFGWKLGLACVLVIAGAWLCSRSVTVPDSGG